MNEKIKNRLILVLAITVLICMVVSTYCISKVDEMSKDISFLLEYAEMTQKALEAQEDVNTVNNGMWETQNEFNIAITSLMGIY